MISAVRVCELLESAYGSPNCKPRYRPLDELVLTILSQSTTAANYTRAFEGLRARFANWDDVRRADTAEIEDSIRSGGLAHTKAIRIRQVLEELYSARGDLSLDFLFDMSDIDAREFLMRFEGVGIKTASCVLLFSMNRPVLPVDTHVHRITRRLGLIGRSVNAEEAHFALQKMIPDEMVYSFHVNLVTHGRRICKAQNPKCDDCVLLEWCAWGQSELATRGD
ncbi:MAG TPA: endonuclease III [Armatimonadota bacterium]|jgi:endonuclease-3